MFLGVFMCFSWEFFYFFLNKLHRYLIILCSLFIFVSLHLIHRRLQFAIIYELNMLSENINGLMNLFNVMNSKMWIDNSKYFSFSHFKLYYYLTLQYSTFSTNLPIINNELFYFWYYSFITLVKNTSSIIVTRMWTVLFNAINSYACI